MRKATRMTRPLTTNRFQEEMLRVMDRKHHWAWPTFSDGTARRLAAAVVPAFTGPLGHLQERPAERHGPGRPRPDVPEHPPVPEHDRDGERARRDAHPAEGELDRRDPLDAARPARGGGGARDRAREYLELVGLKGRDDLLAKNLPYGDQRRLEVARALGSKPSLLLLDEPTAGMNPRETAAAHRPHRPAPPRPRPHRPADRARHARRHGHQRPRHGPRPRREDRRGDAGRGPPQPAGHRGLPRARRRT